MRLKIKSNSCSSIALLAISCLAFGPYRAEAQAHDDIPSRIASPILDAQVTTLSGSVHPLANPENDRGPVAPETRMDRMVLLLQPSAGRQAALDALVQAQHTPGSPLFHQWITPQDYAARFGVSPSDIAKVEAWLTSHGFQVEPRPASNSLVIFSGTAAQVQDAFHTEIHNYAVAGQMHIANSQDPQIPTALAPVIRGIVSLHNFPRNSNLRRLKQLGVASPDHARPDYSSGGTHYLYPDDFAAIYNLNPVYKKNVTGTGIGIAIVGRSQINLSDVNGFRSASALSTNPPTLIVDGANPGFVSGDQDEATLDVEWSGAVAPAATVKYVIAGSTNSTDGVDLSAQYIVNHDLAPVMSTSFGSCEQDMGSTELAFYNSLWEQAASEGISAFVSSGDGGAAGCDAHTAGKGTIAAVNGLCSSPYSTCVGGTEFNEGSGNYWSSSNGTGGESALSYIPEVVWNESGSNGGSGLWASGGGKSVTYSQPSWQKSVAGAGQSDGMRGVPDVALTAAGHDGYLVEENGSWYVFSGTSAASPSFAAIQALVDQSQSGVGQGNANTTLYSLAGSSSNPFHETTAGNNTVPGVTGYTAGTAAYNLATGLGSVNAELLLDAWSAQSSSATAGFSLSASTGSLTLKSGATGTTSVQVTAIGSFSQTVTLSATSATKGIAATLSSTTVKPGGSVSVTVSVASTVASGTYSVTLTGVAGSTTKTMTLQIVVVAQPTLTVSAAYSGVNVLVGKVATDLVTVTTGGSFTGAVALSVSGLPSGVTAVFSPSSLASPGSGTSTLTFTAASSAAASTTKITLTASGDSLTSTTVVTLTVTPLPALDMTLTTTSATATLGSSFAVKGTGTAVGGLVLPLAGEGLTVNITGLPASGFTASKPTILVSGNGTIVNFSISVAVAATATPGTYPTKVTLSYSGVPGAVYGQSATFTVTVPKPSPTLAIGAASSSLTLSQGGVAAVQLTSTTTWFTGNVTWQVSGLPSGVTASWSQNPIPSPGSGTTTLTLTATKTANLGTAKITVKASGDSLSASTTLSLSVISSSSSRPRAIGVMRPF